MDAITTVTDIIQFVLQMDKVECDCSNGSDMVIPVYDISPDEFLEFADNALALETKEGIVNAVSNLKRALDCQMDMFFESINLKSIFDKKNLKFEKKTQFLADIGLMQNRTINKLNSMRNKMEHEYKIPDISDLHTYYELVWSVVKIAELYLELFCANGEIQLSFGMKNKEYFLVLEYNAAGRAFQFEIIDWTEKNNRKQKKIIAGLKNPGEEQDFIRAFHLYLLTIQYFDCGNVTVYKEKMERLKYKSM